VKALLPSIATAAMLLSSVAMAQPINGPYGPGQLTSYSGTITSVNHGTAAAHFCLSGGVCAGFALNNVRPDGSPDFLLNLVNEGQFNLIASNIGHMIFFDVVTGGSIPCAPQFCLGNTSSAQAVNPQTVPPAE
jgi:hypothetical protein